MYRIEGKIKGVAPILFNRMLEDELEPPAGGKGRVSVQDRIEEASRRAYQDERGIYLPGWNFKQCLLEGCKKSGLKVGRASMASYMQAAVFPDRRLYFDGAKEPDFIHETWGRRPPRTGGACVVRRPGLEEGWVLSFGLNVADDRRTPGEVRRSLDEAGLLVGLGSWRPEYGRFLVVEWTMVTPE